MHRPLVPKNQMKFILPIKLDNQISTKKKKSTYFLSFTKFYTEKLGFLHVNGKG